MVTAFRKQIRLLSISGCAAIFLCSCQTQQEPTPEKEPPSAVVEPEPSAPKKPEVAPKPVTPTPKPKPSTPRAAGIAKQAKDAGAVTRKDSDGVWIVEKEGRTLRLFEDERKAELDGVAIFLDAPFEQRKRAYALSDSDVEYMFGLAMSPAKGALRSRTIVIDPGHGGSDRGTRSESLNLSEKDINLDISVRMQGLLEEMGYKVVLTRYDDRLLSLEDRTKIANRSNAGVFVSVHFNAALNEEAEGIEAYVLTPAGVASTNDSELGNDAGEWPGNDFDHLNFDLGFAIQKALISDLQRMDRGLKKARWKVLKELGCPGVLVECGFLSHSKEALLVNTPVYRQKLAESLAMSLDAFANRHSE